MAKTKKKSLKKKINPEKSNKMIIAVVAGLAVLIIGFLSYTIMSDSTGESAEDVMKDTLSYIERTPGVKEIKFIPEENRVVIIYKGTAKEDKETEGFDYIKITRFAGVKLSNKMGDQELTLTLCIDDETNKEYWVKLKSGKVEEEKRFK